MSKMIKIRNVPDDLHRKLKARAAMAGMSLSDYLLRDAGRLAERLTLDEMLARIGSRPRVNPKQSPADVIREMRDSH